MNNHDKMIQLIRDERLIIKDIDAQDFLLSLVKDAKN